MRYMGLDIGTKTIGVAVSDLLGLTAQGVTTIHRKSLEDDLTALAVIVKEYEVGSIVAGLPKNMNGTVGPMAEKAMEFAGILKERLGMPLYFQDERLSTVSANRVLLEGDLSRKKRKQVIDKMAAVFILQAFLDGPARRVQH